MSSPSQPQRLGKVVQHPRSAAAGLPAVEKRPALTARPPLSDSPASRGARQTFGDIIRRAREMRGIDLRDVAEATKINVRYLEALERNDFTYIPGGIHARNFVRSYAQQIGVDPCEMVNAFLAELSQQGVKANADAAAPVAPLRAEDPTVHSLRSHYNVKAGADDRRRRLARTLLLVAALVVVAAAAGAGLWYAARALGERAAPASSPAPTVSTPSR